MMSTNYVMINALEKIYNVKEIFKKTYCGNLAHGAYYMGEFS